MKRTGIKRGKPLAPGGPLSRKGSRPGRGAPIKPVNTKRKREAYARNFGPEADAVRAMPCSVHRALAIHGGWGADEWMIDEPWPDGWTPCTHQASEAAHVEPRGMGACNGDGRVGLVPLCRGHHEEAGEARTSKRAAFETRYGLDLRREADRIAVGHEPPLGIRGLAQRWDDWEQNTLSDHEHDALYGWVRREMEREVERRSTGQVGEDEPSFAWCREALAYRIMQALGAPFTEDTHGEHGLAWTLCEAAGWPS